MSGRKKTKIDWDMVGKMLQAHCKATGIADLIGVSVDTLYVRCKSDLNMDFSAFTQQKRASGKELLRQKQYSTAMKGDKSMLIWLGKQYLEQKDKKEVDQTNTNVEPLKIVVENEEQAKRISAIQ